MKEFGKLYFHKLSVTKIGLEIYPCCFGTCSLVETVNLSSKTHYICFTVLSYPRIRKGPLRTMFATLRSCAARQSSTLLFCFDFDKIGVTDIRHGMMIICWSR